MYVCMYVYACMYVYTYVRMYMERMCVYMSVSTAQSQCEYTCIHIYIHIRMYSLTPFSNFLNSSVHHNLLACSKDKQKKSIVMCVCVYVMYVWLRCMNVCMYVCMKYMYVRTYVCMSMDASQ